MKRYLHIAIAAVALLATICFWALAASAATTNVTLAWDANTEPDLAGYKLYEAAPTCAAAFAAKVSVGLVTTTTLMAVPDGGRCWRLTAVDTVGNESAPSNTVFLQLDTTPPAIPRNLIPAGLVRVP